MDGNINTLFNNLATDIRNVSVAVGVFALMWGALQYAASGGSPSVVRPQRPAQRHAVEKRPQRSIKTAGTAVLDAAMLLRQSREPVCDARIAVAVRLQCRPTR